MIERSATDDLVFRRATASDLPILVQMIADDSLGASREVTSETCADCYRLAFSSIEMDPNQYLMVATTKEGRILGTLQMSFFATLSRRGAIRARVCQSAHNRDPGSARKRDPS